MHPSKRNAGFTLIEVIIAVALVAIMAVAIAPPLVQNIKQGKITRTQSDVQAISTAIMSFYKDVGDWPTASPAGGTLNRLAGNLSLGGGNNGIPAGSNAVTGAGRWRNYGQVGTLEEYLIRNRTAASAELYRVSRSPMSTPGWNGPYLSDIKLDPWGSPYVVNIRYALPALAGTATENYDMHNVIIVSAGPNKVFETPFDDAVYDEQAGGDDIAYMIQRASRY
ncbi:prepilin-type N-terminal cleavage/methylation domain-containing protein [bacterium]|nr:prepilin-type N-terminal cleavage/methylation domain-containing protein [bacterium]